MDGCNLYYFYAGVATRGQSPKAELETRLTTMDTPESSRNRDCADVTNTPEDLHATPERRRRAEDPHMALVGKQIVEEHAHWWGPEKMARQGVNHASRVEGVGAATYRRASDECCAALGREISEEKEKSRGN